MKELATLIIGGMCFVGVLGVYVFAYSLCRVAAMADAARLSEAAVRCAVRCALTLLCRGGSLLPE